MNASKVPSRTPFASNPKGEVSGGILGSRPWICCHPKITRQRKCCRKVGPNALEKKKRGGVVVDENGKDDDEEDDDNGDVYISTPYRKSFTTYHCPPTHKKRKEKREKKHQKKETQKIEKEKTL